MKLIVVVVVFVVGFVVAAFVQPTVGQGDSGYGYDCCSIYMMDVRGRVAIETRRQLTSGSYVALRVRACNTVPVAIQIWRRVSNNTFTFRWQTVVNPVLSTTTRTYVTVSFGSPLVISSDDRLGLFSPLSNDSSNLPIPYGFDENFDYLYYSTSPFVSFSDFSGSLQVTTDDLRWPRSFNGSVFFCTQSDCSDVGFPMSRGTTPFVPPTSPSNTQCCPNVRSCDTTPIIGPITNQSAELQKLNKQVNDITQLITNLLANRPVTGICPQGFTPGSYGVGKCYLLLRDQVSMAVAAIRCQAQYNSLLVQIKNILEDSFLRTYLSSIGSTAGSYVSFWTAGMYNSPLATWFWYDESSRVKSPMIYTNWFNNIRPVPTSDADVCASLVVQQGSTNSSYWLKTDCNQNNFFICQAPKTCL